MHLRALDRIPNLAHLLPRQPNLNSTQILLEILNLLRTRDGNDILALRHQPSEGQLARGTALLPGERLDLLDELEVLGEILGREARRHAAEIALFEIVGRFVLARHEAAAEGAVRDGGDAEGAADGEEVDGWVFDVHAEGAVFDLHGRDRVDFVRAPERFGGAFAEAEVFDLALPARQMVCQRLG